MALILTGRDELFAQWAAARIPHIEKVENFGKYVAVGVATGNQASDKLLAVVIYHDFYPKYGHCQISVVAADARWVSRSTIRGLLSIPFEQYGCNKVWVAVPHDQERTLKLAKALGFIREAVLKDHFGVGTHAVISRLMKREYDKRYWTQQKAA